MLGGFPRKATGAQGLTCLLMGIGVAVLYSGQRIQVGSSTPSQRIPRKSMGYPQLVSVVPMPPADGPMCQWLPARANTTLAAALQQEPMAAQPAAAASADAGTSIHADRAPVRVIRDTYPTYSAVGVDLNTNEIFLQDENLFGINVFNRSDNTPPGASFTEPKRTVAGLQTKLEFNCGLYVDPKTGDIYSVNNDTGNTLVIFPRDAKGNVAPARELTTPHGTYGIAVDEGAEELFLTVEHDNAVVVYRKMAGGNEKPVRTLQGVRTGLEDPHGIALDTKNNRMFVSNHGHFMNRKAFGSGHFDPPSITVYSLKASGDTAPLQIIEGPKTQLDMPAAIYVDEERGELYVANDGGHSILVFRATDQGDATPNRVIQGPKTGIKNPTGLFVDLKNDEVWVSNMGNHRATVYPRTANGNVAPLRTIRSAPEEKLALVIGNPGAVGYDNKREEILVPN